MEEGMERKTFLDRGIELIVWPKTFRIEMSMRFSFLFYLPVTKDFYDNDNSSVIHSAVSEILSLTAAAAVASTAANSGG